MQFIVVYDHVKIRKHKLFWSLCDETRDEIQMIRNQSCHKNWHYKTGEMCNRLIAEANGKQFVFCVFFLK